MGAVAQAKRHAAEVAAGLRAEYPDVHCALQHENALQLLVATILSAQCTDERVNQVTPELFARYPTAADLAAVPLPVLEKAIQSTGFFRNKARNIKACCQQLVEHHNGQVPREMDALVALPGVGRKTANVVLGTAYGLSTGIVVDTHVTRLSNRMGLTRHTDAVKIEQDLMKLLPADDWIDFSHRMIHHGRKVCGARKPLCDQCMLGEICPKIGVPASAGPAAKRTGDTKVAAKSRVAGSGATRPAAGRRSKTPISSPSDSKTVRSPRKSARRRSSTR